MLRKSDAAKLRVTPVAGSPCQYVVADGHAALFGQPPDMLLLPRCDLGADILGASVLGREGCILLVFCHITLF